MNLDLDIDKSSPIKISQYPTNDNSKELNIFDHNPKIHSKNLFQIFLLIGLYFVCIIIFFVLLKLCPNVRLFFIDIANRGEPFGFATILICIGLGVILNMIGMPVAFYEILLGFLWKRFDYGILIGTSFRVLSILFGYMISKKYLLDIMTLYLSEFKYFKGMCYLAKTKPLSSILMLRFCYIPSVLKLYSPPIFGFSLFYCLVGGLCSSLFFCSVNVSIGITAVSLASIGNVEQESFFVKVLPIIIMVLGIILQIFLFFYSQNVMKEFENIEINNEESKRESISSNKPKKSSWKGKQPEFMIENDDDHKSEMNEDRTIVPDKEIDVIDFLI